MWVFDATPLIYLANADRLSHIQHLDDPCVIPERVYSEVVETGMEYEYPDARRVERCIEADQFEVVTTPTNDLFSRLQSNDHLSTADAAVLAYATQHDAVAVMDEAYGRDVAATEEIQTRGTAYLVITLAKRGDISTEDARNTIDDMLEAGWYCAPAFYAKILRKLETLEE